MNKIKKIAFGVTTGLTALYLSAGSVFATTLCPSGNQFSALCTSNLTAEGVVSTGINILLFVAFVAALGFLIFGGIRWITSGGDKEGTAKAKSTVTSALIGLVIVLASWILLNVITRFFNLGSITNLTLPNLPPTN